MLCFKILVGLCAVYGATALATVEVENESLKDDKEGDVASDQENLDDPKITWSAGENQSFNIQD